jgi:hypothetical protein
MSTDRPLGDVEQELKDFCTKTLFALSFYHLRGISEGTYMITFPIGRSPHKIREDIPSFLEAENLEVSSKFEL